MNLSNLASALVVVVGVVGVALLTPSARAQAIGPDMINSSLWDLARYGTDAAGTTTAYAIGAVTCNHGDLPAMVFPAGNTILRPLVAQNFYRYKTVTAPSGGLYQRFEQVGQSWVKRVAVPAGGTNSTCGSCTPGPAGTMGVNCADLYSTAFNGNQSQLGPRSQCNPAHGTSTGAVGTSVGDNITRGRIQVPTADVISQPAGTRFYAETIHLLPDDAQYVRPSATVAINAMNNAASQEMNINGGTAAPSLVGGNGLTAQVPAITRWREIDPTVTIITVDHDDTPNPNSSFPNTFIRCRFWVAAKATDVGNGLWRYEYAVFNLNSPRACGSFTLGLGSNAPLSDASFHHPLSHSGEIYSNTPWSWSRSSDTLSIATSPYTTNPNANAARWGTTYNFGFTTTMPPTTGTAQLGLFAPGAGPSQLAVPGLPVPTIPTGCTADFDHDLSPGTDQDIQAFFACLGGNCCPTCPSSADFNADGDTGTDGDIESFFRVLGGGAC